MSFWSRWRWSAFNFDNLFEFWFLFCVIISFQIVVSRWRHFRCRIVIWIVIITLRKKIIHEDPNTNSHQIIHLELKLFSCRLFWFGLFCHVGSTRLVVLYLADSILELKSEMLRKMGQQMQLQSATYSQEWDAWIENIFEVNEDVFGQESSFPDNPFCWFILYLPKCRIKFSRF